MKYLLSLFMLGLSSLSTFASTLPDGEDIVRKVNLRDEGEAVSRKLTMELVDRNGKVRVRDTQAFRKYYGDEKRTAIFYLHPKNVKGVAFLTYDYKDEEDDQWLYLPAMRKVRRISASDRGDYFLGTDFTYDEIKLETRISNEDYTHKTLRAQMLDGVRCFVVESTPVNQVVIEELGISRREDCIDSDIWLVRESKLWDPKGKAFKTITFRDVKLIEGIWTAHEITAKNHLTQHSSRFVFSEVKYNQGVNDRIFTQNSLRRGL